MRRGRIRIMRSDAENVAREKELSYLWKIMRTYLSGI